jgi:AcrR family transcriptional regulator
MKGKRSYEMRKRRESQQATRQRIVEATMHLHEEIGPRATSISAIAERAGVQRLTVYRHFPDETAVFQACTAHWLSLHPLPDPAAWKSIADATARTRAALLALYGYYRSTCRMWDAAWREAPDVPALHEPMARVGAYLHAIGEDLADGFEPRHDRTALAATIHHALAFPTWQSLDANGLRRDPAKADNVLHWIAALGRNRKAI